MAIEYRMKNGIEYALISKSVRNGSKVSKAPRINLGRVIDKEKGIYKNRERGLFMYDPSADEYSKVPADYLEPPTRRKKKYRDREILEVEFGSIFFFDTFTEKCNMWKAVDAIHAGNRDTLHALIAYYCLTPYSNRHASFWWNYTYARILYPHAQMASQRISEMLEDLGQEEAKRLFFKAYYKILAGSSAKSRAAGFDLDDGTAGDGILIDSTGLPNACSLPVTAVNNHNGVISEEVRLIYVVQQKTGLPLFFRYVAGNIIDATTIKTTVAELKASGINTRYAILDAGYYNGRNADVLMDAGISFLSRMNSNYTVYKNAMAEHRSTLEAKENLVVFNGRIVYVKCIECLIGEKSDRPAYAYLCLDCTMKREEEYKLSLRISDTDMNASEIHEKRSSQGIFMLVSTRRIAKASLLPLYYTRNQVEDIFKLCKGRCKILPINIQNEATLRGHLLITFIATVLMKMLSDQLKETNITTEMLFMALDQHRAKIYEKKIIVNEATKIMNFAYRKFKMNVPTEIDYEAPDGLWDLINNIGADWVTTEQL